MLRQALDDAERGRNDQAAVPQTPSETDSLLPSSAATPPSYATNEPQAEDDADLHSSDDDEEYTVDDWNEDEDIIESPPTLLSRTWTAVKACFATLVDVENLWDSPGLNESQYVSGRKKYIVFLWFFILAVSYASERYTFKLLVDRSGPFRLFAVEMLTFSHALMIGLGMLVSAISRKNFAMEPLGIPIVDVGLMALLDTVHLLLVFLSGYHVAPTLTVILVQFTLPLTAMLTQFVHRDGCFKRCCGGSQQVTEEGSPEAPPPPPPPVVQQGRSLAGWGGLSVEHVLGSGIIALAVLLALSPAFYTIWDPFFFIYADTIPIQTAYNTLLFVSGCIPAAASQLYKEHIFLQYKQPVQPDFLNFILSLFQLIFTSIMSPLVYTLLGLCAGDNWPSLYPSSGFSKNVVEGFQCFLGVLDQDRAENGYIDNAQCQYCMGLVLLHSFSIIAVGVAVDKIINAGATKVMYRGVSAGIIVAVMSLYFYDMHIPDFNYGPAIDSLNLVCVLLLMVGAEVYHRVSIEDATFETVYPEVENYYEDG
eukprot:Nitzschia sp. Nitz4//scaffold3_size479765//168785//170480//NITZ4_000069-RA/size479765-augustus-gene-0.34-mRNA-1//-1//CDS//3329550665//1648//frame0